MNNDGKVKIKETFAYYLPQFHEIEENNKWWGKGFTEWVNLDRAKIIFPDQEILYPGELGYYELNNASIIGKQYEIALKNNVTSFCFWHYWFDDNEKLLHKPAELLLESDIHVRFCFAWANHSWWNKTKNILLKEQKYDFSIEKHFEYLLPFFQDDRYTKIDGKPVFVIYKHTDFPDFISSKEKYEGLAIKAGLPGIFWIGENTKKSDADKFDLFLNSGPFLKYRSVLRRIYDKAIVSFAKRGVKIPRRYDYGKCIKKINCHVEPLSNEIPIIFPRWDSTIRHGKGGMYLHGSNPEIFEQHLIDCKKIVSQKHSDSSRFLFIKSWNEWAEGNFIEPDNIYNDEYLKRFSKHFDWVGE
ncbi:glycoside hydrolase family 99-like domain-containing protein [Vibrio vulnificus]|uniref:glycosyltransferase WbsX family protein n=1 Tax=Vibrio vulnificus TaxID=672 RepID=UPI002FBEF27D